MSAGPFQDALDFVTDALDRERVPWAVTGSFALAYHGIVRATHDIDLKVSASADSAALARVASALAPRMRAIDATTFRYHEQVDVELYPLDGSIDRDSLARRRRVRLFPASAREYWVVTPEDLLLSKLRELARWSDLKQADDLRKLAVVRRADLDWGYLEPRIARDSALSDAWHRWVEPS